MADFDPGRVTPVRHEFSDHPLLQLDELRALANRLWSAGTDKVKFIDPSATPESAFEIKTTSHDGRTIDQIFDHIDTPGTWIAIYEAGADPTYRELITSILHEAEALVAPVDPGMFDSDAFIFISAAPAVTPFHIDRENNFFLQIHGTKRMRVWQPDDRATVSEAAVEGWIAGGSLADVTLDETNAGRAALDAVLGPGDGVYMPSTSAHTSETIGDETGYSVSVGVVYYTAATRRRANLHAFNSFLRKLGFTPRGPRGGRFGLGDRAKSTAGWVCTRGLAAVGRYRIPRGM